ncbi:hypothetical protein ACGFMM_24260 [Streptomyces sp. NPDC048604]|uniref:hypothetical protein n=1 Tax=Streptomyces sp. NPDC048604 TaxID=3365578 RepID=UPI0037129D64
MDDFELFLSRCRALTVASVPACLGVMVFFFKEEGWHFSLLLGCVLPPIAAYLGIRGKRDIRGGLAAAGLALAVVALPLTLVLARFEGA